MSTDRAGAMRAVARLAHVAGHQGLILGGSTQGSSWRHRRFPLLRGVGERVCRDFPVREQCGVLMPLASEEERDPLGPGSAPPALLVSSLAFSKFSRWELYENSVSDQIWDLKWLIFRDLFFI